MKEPTMEEVLKLVEFYRDEGRLKVYQVFGDVKCSVVGSIGGSVWGSVGGDIEGSVGGDIEGSVGGDIKDSIQGSIEGTVEGTISGREWQFVETPKERAIRLIRRRRYEEAIMALEEETD